MQTLYTNYPYILFYLNSGDNYEVMPFRSPTEIPKAFKKNTSYAYSKHGDGINAPHWFNYEPASPDHYNGGFIGTDTEKIPSEVLALSLLIGIK